MYSANNSDLDRIREALFKQLIKWKLIGSKLENFKIHKNLEINFDEKNIIIGENGAWKNFYIPCNIIWIIWKRFFT